MDGKNIKIYKDVILKDNKLSDNVSIGDFSIVRNSVLEEKVEIGRRNTIESSTIDKATYTGEFCIVKYAKLGKYCALSWNISIGGANHDIHNLSSAPLSRIFSDEKLKYKSFENEKITIGNDVWIAAGAHILRGVTIGNGAVIAANAVVTKDVEPYSVYAGVPAKKIGQRFDDEKIRELLKIKWWDWDEDKLSAAKDYFKSPLNSDIVLKLSKFNEEWK